MKNVPLHPVSFVYTHKSEGSAAPAGAGAFPSIPSDRGSAAVAPPRAGPLRLAPLAGRSSGAGPFPGTLLRGWTFPGHFTPGLDSSRTLYSGAFVFPDRAACLPLRRHKLRIIRFRRYAKAHSLRCSSSPRRVPLGSPVRLQARSRRLPFATNSPRVNGGRWPSAAQSKRGRMRWKSIGKSQARLFRRFTPHQSSSMTASPQGEAMRCIRAFFVTSPNPVCSSRT